MTTVEVLVPLRLETRFVAPQDRLDGVPEWQLRLRVWPDDVSIRRTVPPPSPAELDRLAEVTEGGKDRWWFAWRNNGTARGITVGKFSTPEEAMAATDEAG